MKWLIISDDNKVTERLQKVISEKFAGSVTYTASSKKDQLESIVQLLPEISHAVILPTINQNDLLTFISGFLCGVETLIFTTNTDIDESLLNFDLIQAFDSNEDLIEFIETKSKELIEDNFQAEAYDYLYQNGYPFDADNFARYIEKWKKKVCESYVAAGMSVNSVDSDGTPMLNIAARSDNLAAVKWLVANGAEIDSLSKDRGYTAIMDAVWRGNLEITQFLVKKGAELNTISKEGQTMLVLAVGADKVDIVKVLAENGADPDIQDGMGMSAYGYAQLFKKQEILSILEKYHKED